MIKPTKPAAQLKVIFSAAPSNSAIAVGWRLTCTLALPLPLEGKIDEPGSTLGAAKRELRGEAAMSPMRAYSLFGDDVPFGRLVAIACSLASPIARDVRPLAPTTGVARTASDVKPLVPTTGVKTTAGDVRPLAAAIGVEKIASDVRPF